MSTLIIHHDYNVKWNVYDGNMGVVFFSCEALGIIRTKTEVIKTALQNLIQKEKVKDLKKYYGKIDLDIDLDTLRNR
jgi:uncharacterized phage-like protein YoqJ